MPARTPEMTVDASVLLAPPAADELTERNVRFYEQLWRDTYLVPPERFNTWPLVTALTAAAGACLEIGPGLRPRLPIAGTTFVDVSRHALAALGARGGVAIRSDARALPFPDASFELVCLLDLIEHVADDGRIFAEVARVLAPGGVLLLSTPLHPESWTEFDALAGHYRRYEPAELLARLVEHGLALEQSAVYGQQPRSRTLVRLGVWGLTRRRRQAMRWYNRVLLPLRLFFERPLTFTPGLVDTRDVDEVLLVCRRAPL